MKVLSLFDGIACGMVALKRAQIPVDTYFASEIEPNAIRVAKHQHPEIIEIGNVCHIHYNSGTLVTDNGSFEVGVIDLLIGGSPCTNFSSIGYANGMTTGDDEILSLRQYLQLKEDGTAFVGQSYLFWEYVRLLKEIQPRFFLLENVAMARKWEDVITEATGVIPLKINSSLLSAQNRPRLYWTNIPAVTVPADAHITLDDIFDEQADKSDVTYCETVQRSLPRLIDKYGYLPSRFNAYNASRIRDKGCALSRGSMITSSCATLVFVKVENGVHTVCNGMLDNIYPVRMEDGRYNLRKLSLKEQERLQTLPDDYTKVDGVGNQKRSEIIGNGWTVDVIAHMFGNLKLP